MKLDQVAYYCNTPGTAAYVKQILGLTNEPWVKDQVTARSSIYGGPFTRNVAQLEFNYSLGIEVEILRYISGPFWHQRTLLKEPFVSHIGFHLDDGEEFPEIAGLGKGVCKLAQETFTEVHTNDYLTKGAGAGRLFHYKVFEMQQNNYVKYIRRVRDNEKGYTGETA